MDKDEIDLSAYPSYLGVRRGAAGASEAAPREAVVRGLGAALLTGLLGAVLGVAVSRLMSVPELLSPATGAVTSGAMVLLYARVAGAAPRRGLIPLIVLLLMILATTFFGILAGKAWWVYSLIAPVPFSRASFVWGAVLDPDISGILDDILFQLTLFSFFGSTLALWKVRRRPQA